MLMLKKNVGMGLKAEVQATSCRRSPHASPSAKISSYALAAVATAMIVLCDSPVAEALIDSPSHVALRSPLLAAQGTPMTVTMHTGQSTIRPVKQCEGGTEGGCAK